MYQRDATTSIERCTFSGCSAEGSGGAVSSEGFSRMSLTNVQLDSNTASTGGAVALTSAILVFLNNVNFTRNRALFRGGGLYVNAVTYVLST